MAKKPKKQNKVEGYIDYVRIPRRFTTQFQLIEFFKSAAKEIKPNCSARLIDEPVMLYETIENSGEVVSSQRYSQGIQTLQIYSKNKGKGRLMLEASVFHVDPMARLGFEGDKNLIDKVCDKLSGDKLGRKVSVEAPEYRLSSVLDFRHLS